MIHIESALELAGMKKAGSRPAFFCRRILASANQLRFVVLVPLVPLLPEP